MSRIAQAMAALFGRGTPAPESPRYSHPEWWGQWRVPRDLFLIADEQVAISVAWGCIRAITDPIAASEIKVYEESQGVRREDRESWLYWLLNVEPHPGYTAQGWGEIMGSRAIAKGNSYAYIRRDGSSRPFSLQPLDPDRMLADDEGGAIVYRYADPVNGEVRMPEADVLHFRGPMIGGFYGDSPLARASASLALAKAQEDYATAYYANGAYPGVLLKPPATGGPALTDAQKKEARSAWKSLFGGGPKKAKGIGIVDPGWSLEVVPTDAEKSQMVDARKLQVAEIARYFGVPLHLLGVAESAQGYGKNLAELGKGFVQQTLESWARRFGEELRRKLMPARRAGQMWFIEYDLSRLMKGDEESIARAEEIALRTGVLTINQAKTARGLPTVEGGDVTMVGGIPIDRVINPPKPEPAPKPAQDAGLSTLDVAAALARHARRARARAEDVTRKGATAAQVEEQLSALRLETREWLVALGVKRSPETLVETIRAVEDGIPPDRVAVELTRAA